MMTKQQNASAAETDGAHSDATDLDSTDDVDNDGARSAYFLESLANGLRCLALFGADQPSVTIQEAATLLDVTRPSARRLLLTLKQVGYLEQVDRDFLVTPKVLELGFSYFSSKGLRAIAIPYMEAVAAKTGETCALGVLDGVDIVFLHRAEPKKPMRLDLSIGSRLPAFAHSMGRILLSQLNDEALDQALRTADLKPFTDRTVVDVDQLKQEIARVRERGWSFSNGELMEGIAGVSRPIFNAKGQIVAAINISMILGNHTAAYVEQEMLPHLTQASEAISRIYSSVH
ncbi:IclR family transcriptional regulator domain-containing protein [Noviherbaspirillum saxi]|uniref:IclR family transcriptional regulator n=1 Tax=Noviherbaspirillum saxi TaxID=2320863 RepID=A0A3A3FGH1_9BURK|nr:IclR family transcriptional regulator C-terminal domain-containing protein [Noviherbaspirillum saxi]RJF92486.1 IclR family transcriptional regulator [Noviherbaspirillum saxi]